MYKKTGHKYRFAANKTDRPVDFKSANDWSAEPSVHFRLAE